MIINRPEFLVREYFLVVETPNPLIHLHYFCGSTANLKVASNQPPCSKDLTVLYLALLILGSISAVSLVGLWFPPPPRRGKEECTLFFFGTVTGKRAYALTYPQSLAPKNVRRVSTSYGSNPWAVSSTFGNVMSPNGPLSSNPSKIVTNLVILLPSWYIGPKRGYSCYPYKCLRYNCR